MTTNFLIGAACGLLMWALIRLEKADYKGKYALYLAVITALVLGITFSTRTVFGAGFTLVAYTIFLAVTDPPYKAAFAMPNLWLTVYGFWLIGQLGSGLGTTVTFVALAALALIFPFMEYILYGHAITTDDDTKYEEMVISKNKLFCYFGVIAGLLAAIVFVVFH